MREPSFSVLVPAYNAATTVADTIQSVLSQRTDSTEIIVCDDGSTDTTSAVLRPFADRVQLLAQPNAGRAAALNTCLRASSGTWVVLLDADDRWLPGRLEQLARMAAANPQAGILTTDVVISSEEAPDRRWIENAAPNGFPSSAAEQRHAILQDNFIFSGSAVSRAVLEEAGGFDESYRRAEDYELWVRLILNGVLVAFDPQARVVYNRHGGNLSLQRRSQYEARRRVLRSATEHDLSRDEQTMLANHLAHIDDILDLMSAQEAVSNRHRDARARCLVVARNPRQDPRQRLKAAMAMLSPKTAQRLRSLRS
jgi:glycosyltransferase involved in cell wall biosynthesis